MDSFARCFHTLGNASISLSLPKCPWNRRAALPRAADCIDVLYLGFLLSSSQGVQFAQFEVIKRRVKQRGERDDILVSAIAALGERLGVVHGDTVETLATSPAR